MRTIFVGSQALARGEVTRAGLRTAFQALYPDVYMPKVGDPSLYDRTVGAYLWSGERGVITGRAAAALHGARWVDDDSPIELLWNNNHPPPGIVTRNERFSIDEVVELYGMPVASIQRTAFDLGRHLMRSNAVAHLDDLARVTGASAEHVLPLVELYKGARGVRRLTECLELMDPGSQSPKETWLRLLLVEAGFTRPATQIPVFASAAKPFAYLDMGWEHLKIAVEYDGDYHRADRSRYAWDVRRLAMLHRLGWLHIRVIAEDRPGYIVDQVRRAFSVRETEGMVIKQPA
ncbi:hypothetical protein [Mycobacterium sp. IDR2000157661]|uniref:hypothetical protein n=1 Tax=Mycobacterium sp. IDR2000157661 TaxID=2867005 RepID=UPI001EEA56EF|nr:hypothetical protein [Mycobacterium sp. IDR2000157661]ULE33071.1 hypothetical protein K3G64_23960 [Mycobacterium sp. IDR2000157661]